MSKNYHNPYEKDRKPPPPSTAASASSLASALVVAAADKAGMGGIDRNRIDQIILRESNSSLYLQQQQRRDQKVNQKIARLRLALQEQQPSLATHEIDQLLSNCKPAPRSTAVVFDMDMFYMACECLTRPELYDTPAVVGGSMILTSNYQARRYGVRSAMAGWIGDALVHELSEGKEKLIHVKAHFDLYREKSHVVRQVLAEYDPQLRAYSLDEAYMDLGPYLVLKLTNPVRSHDEIRRSLQLQESDETDDNDDASMHALLQFTNRQCLEAADVVLKDMRQRVKDRTGGLACSAGLAPNHLVAKMASDHNKPNGQCLVDHERLREFLFPLKIRKVSGIGRVTEKILQAFGIEKVEDIYEQRGLVRFLFPDAQGDFLLCASIGYSRSNGGDSNDGQKGVSRERTFRALDQMDDIYTKLEEIGHLLSKDMMSKKLRALTLTVKVKLKTFDCLSKSRTVSAPLQEPHGIVDLAVTLLKDIRNEFEGKEFSVRLLGIRCSNFYENDGQLKMEQFVSKAEDGKRSPKSTSPKRLEQTKTTKRRMNLQMTLEQFADATNHLEDAVDDVHCPICGQAFPMHANASLNRHVDQCLGVDETEQYCKKGKKQKISDFFTSSS